MGRVTIIDTTIASSTDATPIVIGTSAQAFYPQYPGLVSIRGHQTNVAANGTWETTFIDSFHVSLNGSVGSGAGNGGATGVCRQLLAPTVGSAQCAGREVWTFSAPGLTTAWGQATSAPSGQWTLLASAASLTLQSLGQDGAFTAVTDANPFTVTPVDQNCALRVSLSAVAQNGSNADTIVGVLYAIQKPGAAVPTFPSSYAEVPGAVHWMHTASAAQSIHCEGWIPPLGISGTLYLAVATWPTGGATTVSVGGDSTLSVEMWRSPFGAGELIQQ